jgi:hypothetical protein
MGSDLEAQKCENEYRKLPQEAQTVAFAGSDREGSLQEQTPKVFTISNFSMRHLHRSTRCVYPAMDTRQEETQPLLEDFDKATSPKRSVPISAYAYSTMCISELSTYNLVAES